ncbi:MAG: hypothetical protein DI630_09310 [Gordonia sp. (in: high G+C Gram-positive bacteria)]|nr:MAG: hypothetical protein DI630_09310 [Gordonia sp. (in: high G+C Gram-positive bacteria)]
MANTKQEKREAALFEWVAAARAAGHEVPSSDELSTIAASPEVVGAATEGPTLAWKATIEYILHQVKFGLDPFAVVQNLPQELLTPAEIAAPARHSRERERASSRSAGSLRRPARSPDETPSQPPAPERDPVAALIEWRSRRIADGVEAAGAIKDATLRTLVQRKFISPEQIRKQLPGADSQMAAEIAAVLAEFFPSEAPAPLSPQRNVEAAPATQSSEPVIPARTEPVSAPPEPAGANERAETAADQGLGLTHADFCEYEYGENPIEPGAVTITRGPAGHRLTWEPYLASPEDAVIYRVVANEDVFPHKPEAGELLIATTSVEYEDPRFLTSAVRTYQVWCHVGVDERAARYQQPVLVAAGEVVSPVEDFKLTEDEGRVIAQWNVFPGTRAVRVYRVPLSGGSRGINDPRHEILTNEANLTGFVDADVSRGETYLYRAMAEVTVGATVRLANSVQKEIQVSVVLKPVLDVQITMDTEHAGEFELRWSTPPTGRVSIYRSNTAPPADLEGSEMPVDALSLQGLDETAQLKHPVVAADAASSRMAGVPWPSTWDRTYFTPVTIFGNKAKVGAVKVQTRPVSAVTDARIIERFNAQIVSFGWPAAAASVLAWVAPRSLPAEQAIAGRPDEEIHLRQHRRDGGLTFARELPAGCMVYLVPVAYSGGEQIRGEHVGISYPGLTRVYYSLRTVHEDAEGRVVAVNLATDVDVDTPPPFVLVHNAERFPLGPHDGQTVKLISPHTQQLAWQIVVDRLVRGQSDTGWRARLPLQPGFIRLFADTRAVATPVDDANTFPVRKIALADPPLDSLRLDPPVGPPL